MSTTTLIYIVLGVAGVAVTLYAVSVQQNPQTGYNQGAAAAAGFSDHIVPDLAVQANGFVEGAKEGAMQGLLHPWDSLFGPNGVFTSKK